MLLGAVASQRTGSGGGEPPPEVTPSTMIQSFYVSTTQGNEDLLIYLPEGYGDTPGKTYPLHIAYGGDGSMGSFLVRTDEVLSDIGGNIYTGFIDNPTLTGSRKAFYGSIVVKVAGVEVARCQRAMDGINANFYSTGAIAGITGTVGIATYPDSPIEVHFPSAPGGTVTISYTMSKMFETGLAMYLNNGAYEWPGTIVAVPQKGASGTFYAFQDHWLDLKTHLFANYEIDTDRITVSGISRGGLFVEDLAQNSTYRGEIAAFIQLSGLAFGMSDWTQFSDKGVMIIAGQREDLDSYTVPNGPVLNSAGSVTTLHNYPGSIMVKNGRHNGGTWNSYCFNVAISPFDFRDWCDVWSIDYDKQATLHVEKAEATNNIDRWREAVRCVSFLGAGTLKTELQGRLATLKTEIDGIKKRWILDFGTSTDASPYITVNHLTADFTAGRTYSSLKDDNNNVTPVGLTVVNQFATGPTNRFGTSVRGSNAQFGFTRDNYFDGINMNTAVTNGQFKITGLDPAKTYKLKWYPSNGSTSTLHDITLSTTINSVTKTLFNTYTNRTTLEYTGLSPSGAGEIVVNATASGDTTAIAQILQIEEE